MNRLWKVRNPNNTNCSHFYQSSSFRYNRKMIQRTLLDTKIVTNQSGVEVKRVSEKRGKSHVRFSWMAVMEGLAIVSAVVHNCFSLILSLFLRFAFSFVFNWALWWINRMWTKLKATNFKPRSKINALISIMRPSFTDKVSYVHWLWLVRCSSS